MSVPARRVAGLLLVGVFVLAGVLAVGFAGVGAAADTSEEGNSTAVLDEVESDSTAESNTSAFTDHNTLPFSVNSSHISSPSLSNNVQSPALGLQSSNGPNFTVNITTVNDSVVVGGSVTVEYNVTNVGDQQGIQDIAFEINGTTVDSEPSVELAVDETYNGTFIYQTDSGDPPAIEAAITSENDTATESIGVADGDASIETDVIDEERGDVVEVPLTISDVDVVTVTIGTITDNNYQTNVTLEDGNGDGRIDLRFNTYVAGAEEGSLVFETVADGDSVVEVDRNSDGLSVSPPYDSVLDPNNYELLAVGGKIPPADRSEDDDATLALQDRETENQTVWVTHDNADVSDDDAIRSRIADGNLTQASTIASGDVIVHEVEANGLGGVFQTELTDRRASNVTDAFLNRTASHSEEASNGTASNPAAEWDFWINQTNPGANEKAASLPINHTTLDVVTDPDNGTYYLVYTLSEQTVTEDGDEYETNFTVLADNDLADTPETVVESWTFETAGATLENSDGWINVSADTNQRLTGQTNLAPGTEVAVRVRGSDTENPFVEPLSTRVASDRSIDLTGDFTEHTEGTNYTVVVRRGGSTISPTYDGQFVAGGSAAVVFPDQVRSGDSVTVDEVTTADGGFVVIRLDNATGPIIGTSNYLEAGFHSDLTLTLEHTLDEDTTLVAVAHQDTDGDETFEFPSDSAVDTPYTENGSPVTDSAAVTAEPGPISIKSGVEASGNVEIVTNKSIPQSDIANLEIQLDGTVIYDGDNFGDDGSGSPADSGITSRAPDALHDVVVNTSYQRRHDIRLYDDSDNLVDITPNRNLTVTLTINQSTGETTDVTQEVTVTGATVAESEGIDSAANAQRIYRGAPIALWADVSGNNTGLFLDATGQALSTEPESRLLTVDSTSAQFTSGETVEVEFNSNASNVEYFVVRDLDWSVSAADTDVSADTPIEVTVSATRGGAPFTAEMRNATGAVVATRQQTLGVDGTSTLTFDPQNIDGLSIEGSPYTVTATDNRTSSSATTAEITVGDPATFAVSITDTNTPVAAGETLFVDARVENTGEKSGTQTVTLDVPGLGQDSTDVTLDAGQSTVVTLAVSTETGDVSDYTASVTSEDDSDSTGVSVQEPAAFPVTITDTTSPVRVGETLQVAARVENTGDQSGSTTVALTIDGQQRDATTVSLGAGESQSLVLEWQTAAGEAGGYIAFVETATDDDTASVTVEQESNTPPVATEDSYQADRGTPLSVPTADGVLANDIDPDGDDLTATAVTQPDFGTLNLAANGSFTYTPTAGFTGTDSFTYQVTDGDGGVDTAVVTIEVTTPATAAISAVDIAGQGANATVSEGSNESISVDIENIGGVSGSFDVTIEIANEETMTFSKSTGTIDPDRGVTVTFQNITGELAPEAHAVTITTADDEITASLTVEPVHDLDYYAQFGDEPGVVETTGLREAIDDWRTGEIETDLLRDVIDAWRTGESITLDDPALSQKDLAQTGSTTRHTNRARSGRT